MKQRHLQLAARVAIVYAIAGGLWITLSDRVTEALFRDPVQLTIVQTYKGLAFVLLSSLVLFIYITGESRRTKSSEQKYSELYQSAVEGIFQLTPAGKFLSVNPAMARIFGYPSPEEMCNKVKNAAEEIFLNPQAFQQFTEELTKQGAVEKFEVQNNRYDGIIIWVSINARRVHDPAGKTLYFEGFATDITARKLTEFALHETDARFRNLVEQVPAAVYTDEATNESNSGVYMSPQIETIAGYPAKKWSESSEFWPTIIHPDDLDRFISENIRTNRTGEPFDIEYRIRARDGHIVWLRDMARLIRDDSGKALYWQGLLLDITDRKRTDQEIHASEERFRMVVEGAAEGIFISDPDGNYQEVNPSGCAMMGYRRDEMLRMNIRQLLDPEDFQTQPLHLRKIREGMTIVSERRFLKKDGTRFTAEVSSKLLPDGRMLSIIRDISERIHLEQVRLEEQKRFQALIENSMDGIALYSEDTRVLYQSPAIKKILGYEPLEVEGKTVNLFVHPEDADTLNQSYLKAIRNPAETVRTEARILHKDGSYHWIEAIVSNKLHEPGIEALVANYRDVTERKEAEKKLKESEDQYRRLVEHSPYAIAIHSQGKLVYLNDAGVKLIGAQNAEELYGSSIIEFVHPDSRPTVVKRIQELQHGMEVEPMQERFLRRDGSSVEVEVIAFPFSYQGQPAIQVVVRDLTVQKRAQDAVRSSEERLRAIVDHTSNIYYSYTPDHHITYISPQVRKILGYDPEKTGQDWRQLLTDHPINQRGVELSRLALETGQAQESYILQLKARDGRLIWGEVHESPVVRDGHTLGMVGAITDITERREAERRLERQLTALTVLHAVAIAGTQSNDEDEVIERSTQIISGMLYPDNCGVLLLNPHGTTLTPHPSYHGVLPQNALEEVPLSKGVTGRVAATGLTERVDDVHKDSNYIETTDGILSELCVPIRINEKIIGVINAESRKPNGFDAEDERIMTTLAGTLGSAIERVRLFNSEQKRGQKAENLRQATVALTKTIELDQLFEIILDELDKLVPYNSASIELIDARTTRGGLERNNHRASKHSRRGPIPSPIPGSFNPRRPLIIPDIHTDERFELNDQNRKLHGWVRLPLVAQDELMGFLTMANTTSNYFTDELVAFAQTFANQAGIAIKNAFLYQSEKKRYQEAEKLRQAATVVASSLKLSEVLNILLEQLKEVVPFDSAAVLLPEGDSVRIMAESGLPREEQALGKLYPASNRLLQYILVNNRPLILDDAQKDGRFERWAASENVHGWIGVPMVAHGQVTGFITLDSFTPGAFDEGQAALAQSFAHQAAAAIENAQLFESLKFSNTELSKAYDTTLEGWGNALELRDKETQGHTRRVADLTLELARRMNCTDEQILHIRRGVLVHDIGKMGVPDTILNKKGPLTPREWKEMRKHPQFAFDLLYPIAYLRPSIEIPYCHHEWWNGSGYPRGLKGEQIPLAARLFAVVDVWDALLSDRPYRKHWPRKKVIKYIRDQAGIHFDPKIAEIFLKMIEEKDAGPI